MHDKERELNNAVIAIVTAVGKQEEEEVFYYIRPDGVSRYIRPGGGFYIRPN